MSLTDALLGFVLGFIATLTFLGVLLAVKLRPYMIVRTPFLLHRYKPPHDKRNLTLREAAENVRWAWDQLDDEADLDPDLRFALIDLTDVLEREHAKEE